MKNKIKTISIIKIIAILLLLWALARHPYSYYQILRWFICGLTAYSAYLTYEANNKIWAWIFGIIAILYNPIAPIYFSKNTWSYLNVTVAIIISLSIFKMGITDKTKVRTDNR